MQSVFRPAIALLNRLKYPQKFTLISLLFVLPLALVMFLLISQIDAKITVTQAELDGTAYLRPLRQLREHLPQHNLVAYRYLRGDTALKAELAKTEAQIDNDIQALLTVDRQFGERLGTSNSVKRVVEQWQQIKSQLALQTPNGSLQAHTLLLSTIDTIVVTVGERSNLILDPQLDSYYLMDVVLLKLPEQQSLLAQMLALNAQQIANVAPNQRDWTEVSQRTGRIQNSLSSIKYGITTASKNNPDANVGRNLTTPLQQSDMATSVFLQSVQQHMLDIGKGTQDNFTQLGEQAVSTSFALWDRSAATLDELLQARINRFVRQTYGVEAFAFVILLVVLYLLIAFYRSVMGTVATLDQVASNLINGTTTQMVNVRTRDEFGQVAMAFNRVAKALLDASAQRQAVVAHAVDAIFTLDADRRVTSFNPAAERTFGYAASEIIGQPVNTLMADSEQHRDLSGQARHEIMSRRRDGSSFPAEVAQSEVELGGQRQIIVMLRDISERKQAEAEREQLHAAIIDAQSATLRQLSTPLIPISDRVIVLPLIGTVDEQRAHAIIETLLQGVEAHRADVALLDITGVPVVDMGVADAIVRAAQAVQLLGARVILTGIRPDVAQTLVGIGADLSHIVTRSTLQAGIAYAFAYDQQQRGARLRGERGAAPLA